jgi:hypothetical protein
MTLSIGHAHEGKDSRIEQRRCRAHFADHQKDWG